VEITFKVTTSKPVQEAVADLKNELAAINFSVLWGLNFKDKLQEKGLAFDQDFHVLEVCNPGEAKKALDANIEVGFFLPCKLAVYSQEGQTVIGMAKPTSLMSLMGSDPLGNESPGSESLVSLARRVEETLKTAILRAR